jgi:hypothetical protein
MSRYTDIDLTNKKLPPISGYWSEKVVSLEEALKPIESSIDELSRSIKVAKKHCTFPSEHGLTRDESAAVYLYTMEGGENSFYKVLNAKLRSENRAALKPWFPFLKLFDMAIKKLPTVKGCIWRGISGDVSGQFTKDQVLTWWGISSCSPSLDVIKGFLSPDTCSTVFMIEAINGKDVAGYTYFPHENEILLSLGTELQVKSDTLKHHGGLNIVHLVELSDDDVEELPKAIAEMDLKPKVPVEVAASKC